MINGTRSLANLCIIGTKGSMWVFSVHFALKQFNFPAIFIALLCLTSGKDEIIFIFKFCKVLMFEEKCVSHKGLSYNETINSIIPEAF